MSVGINLICKVIGEMARTLGDDYDIEVIEAHHRLKKDAPSGTALKIAEVLAHSVNRDLNQVGVYARKGMIGERKKKKSGYKPFAPGILSATIPFCSGHGRANRGHPPSQQP